MILRFFMKDGTQHEAVMCDRGTEEYKLYPKIGKPYTIKTKDIQFWGVGGEPVIGFKYLANCVKFHYRNFLKKFFHG